MPPWLANAAVVVALITFLGGLLTPALTKLVERRENGRLKRLAAANAAEANLIEQTERRITGLLDRQAEEIRGQAEEIKALHLELDEHEREIEAQRDQILQLEKQALRTAQKSDRVLAALFGIARETHDGIVSGETPELTIARVRRLMDQIETARGGLFNGTHKESA